MVDEVNACELEPEWVIVGHQFKACNSEPVILVLTCCEVHRLDVERFQCMPTEPAMRFGIEHLDLVIEGLMETGEVYTAAAVPA
jgi:hypothetical protein